MKPIIILSAVLLAVGCRTTPRMNNLGIGMTKGEVIEILGEPHSTASPGGGVEMLRFQLYPTSDHRIWGHPEEYFVRMVDGRVDAYGKLGDFDSTKDPTMNYNVNVKSE